MLKFAVAILPLLSVSRALTVDVPAFWGVPVIDPSALIVSPLAGVIVPVQVYGPFPPAAVRVTVYPSVVL